MRCAFTYIINKYILFVYNTYTYVDSEDYYRGGDGGSGKCVRGAYIEISFSTDLVKKYIYI